MRALVAPEGGGEGDDAGDPVTAALRRGWRRQRRLKELWCDDFDLNNSKSGQIRPGSVRWR